MADEKNNGAVPPKVKLQINKPDEDNNKSGKDNEAVSSYSGPKTIKIKPIKKVAPPAAVVPEGEKSLSKPNTETIQLKSPVDTSSGKVDLKPLNKKTETSKIPLDAAVPKPITIHKASETKDEKPDDTSSDQEKKSKTSRISLDSIMSSVEEPEEKVAPTSRPKTVKLKKPVAAPKVTPSLDSDDSSEESVTPTRKKTIVKRRPAAATTPTVDLTSEEGSAAARSGPQLKTGMPQAGGAYIADRFADIGQVAPKADKPHWIFAVVGILACILLAVTIYVQAAQLPNSGLTWVGQIQQNQF
jgi:hypothetical protein